MGERAVVAYCRICLRYSSRRVCAVLASLLRPWQASLASTSLLSACFLVVGLRRLLLHWTLLRLLSAQAPVDLSLALQLSLLLLIFSSRRQIIQASQQEQHHPSWYRSASCLSRQRYLHHWSWQRALLRAKLVCPTFSLVQMCFF